MKKLAVSCVFGVALAILISIALDPYPATVSATLIVLSTTVSALVYTVMIYMMLFASRKFDVKDYAPVSIKWLAISGALSFIMIVLGLASLLWPHGLTMSKETINIHMAVFVWLLFMGMSYLRFTERKSGN